MKKIAIYSRKSVFEENSNSTGNQISIVKEYMKKFGECTFYVFEDEGFSGGNINRPDFQRMLKMVENNELDIVAVYKIDRIARNIVDFVNVYDTFQKHEVGLVSVTEAFDLTTSMGKLIMMILATFAEMERENIKQRVRDNKIQNAKIGKWTGGYRPLGYNIISNNEDEKVVKYLKVNRDEEHMVSSIYDKFLEEENLSLVSKWCVEKYGIFNTVSSLKRFLSAPLYVKSDDSVLKYLSKIKEVYGKDDGKGILLYGSRSREKKKVEFYTVSKHDGIIEADKWIKVQQIIGSRHQIQKNWSNSSFLSGLVVCKHCNSKMWVYAYGAAEGRYYSFICPNRKYKKSCSNKSIVIHKLEDLTLDYLIQIQASKDAFLKLADEVKVNNMDSQVKKIEKEIKKKEHEIEKLAEKLILLEGTALDIVTKKMNSLSKDIQKLKENLFVLEKEILFSDNKNLNLEYIYDQIVNFNKISDMLSIDQKRAILLKIIKKIEWDGENHEASIFVQ